MASTNRKNYRQLQSELDKVIEQMQATDVNIDEAINLYERGQKLIDEIEKYLKTAKNRVEKLKVKN